MLLSVQDSCVLCDGAERWEDRGGGRAETGLHGGGQLPVDEPRTAGAFPARSNVMQCSLIAFRSSLIWNVVFLRLCWTLCRTLGSCTVFGVCIVLDYSQQSELPHGDVKSHLQSDQTPSWLSGHRQHPRGGRLLSGSGAGQHPSQDSSGRHPPVGDQAAVPGGGAAPLQCPDVPPHLCHQPAQTAAETARWVRVCSGFLGGNLVGSCSCWCADVSVCGRDRSRLCDGGKSGVREENRSGQRQRPGTDWW